MSLLRNIIVLFGDRLIDKTIKRLPDFTIENKNGIYMKRWYLIPRNSYFNIYLHCLMLSDCGDLHDHGYYNCSIILRKGYWEVKYTNKQYSKYEKYYYYRRAGDIIFRRPTPKSKDFSVLKKALHRLQVVESDPGESYSLFITGPRLRTWGFYLEDKNEWVPYDLYVDLNGSISKAKS